MIAAVVPAAGRSERMGRPKLVLPIGGLPVIARVVDALRRGGVHRVAVVAPPTSAPESLAVANAARNAGAEVVIPEQAPPDMRASVALGLAHLDEATAPMTVLLVPGDSPGLSRALVARVVEEAKTRPTSIIVPSLGGRRGHPLALPWSIACEVHELPLSVGVNALVKAHEADVIEVEVADPGALADLDTPEDYQRWVGSS